MSKRRTLYGERSPEDIEKELSRQQSLEKPAKIRVFRFNPKRDREPHYDTFEIPLMENMSVLGALTYIYEYVDSTLPYYGSCRHGRCGACTMVINGKAGLACRTLATENMTIEPVPGFEIIRDLVVDTDKRVPVK